MTHILTFDETYSYRGHTIWVPLRLIPPQGVSFEVRAVVDSGAAISYLDHAIAPRLGIADVRSGVPRTLDSASQTGKQGYVHDVKLEIWGREMTIPAVMCPDWPAGRPNLLGMEGFFEKLRCGLIHDQRLFLFSFA